MELPENSSRPGASASESPGSEKVSSNGGILNSLLSCGRLQEHRPRSDSGLMLSNNSCMEASGNTNNLIPNPGDTETPEADVGSNCLQPFQSEAQIFKPRPQPKASGNKKLRLRNVLRREDGLEKPVIEVMNDKGTNVHTVLMAESVHWIEEHFRTNTYFHETIPDGEKVLKDYRVAIVMSILALGDLKINESLGGIWLKEFRIFLTRKKWSSSSKRHKWTRQMVLVKRKELLEKAEKELLKSSRQRSSSDQHAEGGDQASAAQIHNSTKGSLGLETYKQALQTSGSQGGNQTLSSDASLVFSNHQSQRREEYAETTHHALRVRTKRDHSPESANPIQIRAKGGPERRLKRRKKGAQENCVNDNPVVSSSQQIEPEMDDRMEACDNDATVTSLQQLEWEDCNDDAPVTSLLQLEHEVDRMEDCKDDNPNQENDRIRNCEDNAPIASSEQIKQKIINRIEDCEDGAPLSNSQQLKQEMASGMEACDNNPYPSGSPQPSINVSTPKPPPDYSALLATADNPNFSSPATGVFNLTIPAFPSTKITDNSPSLKQTTPYVLIDFHPSPPIPVVPSREEFRNLKEQLAGSNSQVKELQDKISSTERNLEKGEVKHNEALKAAEALKTLNTQYQRAIEKLEASRAERVPESLKALATEHQAAMKAREKSLSEEDDANDRRMRREYYNRVGDLTRKHKDATEDLRKQLEESVGVREELEASFKQQLQSQQAECSQRISKLKNEFADLNTKSTKDIERLKAVETKSIDDQKALETAQKELAGAQKEIENLQDKIASAEGRLQDLWKDKAKQNESVNSLHAKHRDDVAKLNDEHEIAIGKLKTAIAALNSQIKEWTDKVAALNTERHQKQLDFEGTQERLEASLKQCKNQQAELLEIISNLQNALSVKQAECEVASKELMELDCKCKEDKEALEHLYKKAESDLEAAKKTLKEESERISTLQEERREERAAYGKEIATLKLIHDEASEGAKVAVERLDEENMLFETNWLEENNALSEKLLHLEVEHEKLTEAYKALMLQHEATKEECRKDVEACGVLKAQYKDCQTQLKAQEEELRVYKELKVQNKECQTQLKVQKEEYNRQINELKQAQLELQAQQVLEREADSQPKQEPGDKRIIGNQAFSKDTLPRSPAYPPLEFYASLENYFDPRYDQITKSYSILVNGIERKLKGEDFFPGRSGTFLYKDTDSSKLFWTDLLDPERLGELDEKFVYIEDESDKTYAIQPDSSRFFFQRELWRKDERLAETFGETGEALVCRAGYTRYWTFAWSGEPVKGNRWRAVEQCQQGNEKRYFAENDIETLLNKETIQNSEWQLRFVPTADKTKEKGGIWADFEARCVYFLKAELYHGLFTPPGGLTTTPLGSPLEQPIFLPKETPNEQHLNAPTGIRARSQDTTIEEQTRSGFVPIGAPKSKAGEKNNDAKLGGVSIKPMESLIVASAVIPQEQEEAVRENINEVYNNRSHLDFSQLDALLCHNPFKSGNLGASTAPPTASSTPNKPQTTHTPNFDENYVPPLPLPLPLPIQDTRGKSSPQNLSSTTYNRNSAQTSTALTLKTSLITDDINSKFSTNPLITSISPASSDSDSYYLPGEIPYPLLSSTDSKSPISPGAQAFLPAPLTPPVLASMEDEATQTEYLAQATSLAGENSGRDIKEVPTFTQLRVAPRRATACKKRGFGKGGFGKPRHLWGEVDTQLLEKLFDVYGHQWSEIAKQPGWDHRRVLSNLQVKPSDTKAQAQEKRTKFQTMLRDRARFLNLV